MSMQTLNGTDQTEESMKKTRNIIEIDEEKCTGCGQCILACAEGALALVDGKAKLVGEIYCDGIGACIGTCPADALKIVERPAEEYDEKAVEEHLRKVEHNKVHTGEPGDVLPCGCPSGLMTTLEPKKQNSCGHKQHDVESTLGHWPVKLQLLGPNALFLKDADLLLLADCAAAACPNLHEKVLRDRAVAMGCPKLDDLDAHIERLADILAGARPRSLTVVHMEVPCCGAFVSAAHRAIELAGVDIALGRIIISREGDILKQENLDGPCLMQACQL